LAVGGSGQLSPGRLSRQERAKPRVNFCLDLNKEVVALGANLCVAAINESSVGSHVEQADSGKLDGERGAGFGQSLKLPPM